MQIYITDADLSLSVCATIKDPSSVGSGASIPLPDAQSLGEEIVRRYLELSMSTKLSCSTMRSLIYVVSVDALVFLGGIGGNEQKIPLSQVTVSVTDGDTG